MTDKNVHQRINAVMAEIKYIKRGSAGQGTGVLYDEVIAILQPLLVTHGIVVAVDFLADSSRDNSKGNYVYQGYFDVHYINMDKPEDRLTCKIVSHAMDAGDKAPGKSITYAAKISHLKVFGFETGEADEGRYVEEDIADISAQIMAAESIDELQATFKLGWFNFPKSRDALTAIKDEKKKEFTPPEAA